MMLYFEYMILCPKCKILMFDMIKAHFLGGAFTKPLAMYFSAIDGVHRDAMVEVSRPVVPVVQHEPRYVDFVPVVHGRTTAVAFPSVRLRRRELYKIGSFTMRVLLKRLGEERYPPAVSDLNERFGVEVVEHMRREFAI